MESHDMASIICQALPVGTIPPPPPQLDHHARLRQQRRRRHNHHHPVGRQFDPRAYAAAVAVGPGIYRSPRHRMSFDSRSKGSN
jgi:hypothetical protein